MAIMSFIASNWDSVLIVVAAVVIVIFLIAKKQYAILDKILFAFVTEAEKQFGGGTGALKLAAVIDWVYPKIPAVIRVFITAGKLTQIIETVLAEAKKRWEANQSISEYIKSQGELDKRILPIS
jgi:hypothetical protein